MISLVELVLVLNITVVFMLLLFFNWIDRIQSDSKIFLKLSLVFVACYTALDLLLIQENYSIILYFFPLYYSIVTSFHPLIYLHFKKSIFPKETTMNRRQIKYFLIPISLFILNLIFFLPGDKSQKKLFIEAAINFSVPDSLIFGAINIVFAAAYYTNLLIFMFLLYRFTLRVKKETGRDVRMQLKINRYVLLFICGSILAELVFLIIIAIDDIEFQTIKTIEHAITLVYLMFIGFIGSRQAFFSLQYKLASLIKMKEKSSANKLCPSERDEIKIALEKYLSNSTLYLDPNFSLQVLALKLHLPVHKLSCVINSVYNKNFRSWLTSFRIDYAKKIILEGADHGRIEDVFSRVGFYSKSNFYKAFKEVTGLTPNDFKRHSLKN